MTTLPLSPEPKTVNPGLAGVPKREIGAGNEVLTHWFSYQLSILTGRSIAYKTAAAYEPLPRSRPSFLSAADVVNTYNRMYYFVVRFTWDEADGNETDIYHQNVGYF